jgi:hypothetical protein
VNIITLPPGYYLLPGRCPACDKPLVEADRLEGLPIYACPDRCKEAKP